MINVTMETRKMGKEAAVMSNKQISRKSDRKEERHC